MTAIKSGFLGRPRRNTRWPDLRGEPPVLLATKIAGGYQTMEFTAADFDWTEWDELEFRLLNFLPNVNGALTARVSTDGGATWKQGAGEYATGLYVQATNSAIGTQFGPDTRFLVMETGAGQNASAAFGATCKINVERPYDPTQFKLWRIESKYALTTAGPPPAIVNGVGAYLSGGVDKSPINGLQLQYSSGTIVTGIGRVYGLSKRTT